MVGTRSVRTASRTEGEEDQAPNVMRGADTRTVPQKRPVQQHADAEQY
jgi:hypothetical protein